MTCSAQSTLKPQASVPLPNIPGLTPAGNQAFKIWAQSVLAQIQGAAGATGVNVIPQQYALLAGSTLPPIASTSNCTVTADTGTPLFGAGGSYKIAITGSPATVTFAVDTAWPIHPGSGWIASFFQQASAAIAAVLTITTPTKSYTTDFTTTLSASGFQRLYDTLNLIADTSTSFGLSFTFTGGTGQNVWLDGLMMEPYFGTAMQPSPFISTSGALLLDNNPDGSFSKILSTHTSGNVAYNYKGVWNSTTSYVIGDEVVYGESYWLAVAASTNSAPAGGNANWQVIGSYSAFLGAWSSITTYAVGAEVTYNGNFWIAIVQNSNSAPSTSNANWQIAGPVTLDNIADGTTFQRGQRYLLANITNASAWTHVGTLVLQEAHSATFTWHAGEGYNSSAYQQAISTITIRASNDTVAPNLSGLSCITHGATQPVVALRAVATGNSTSISNTSWEIYFECAAFTDGPLEVVVAADQGDSFTFDGSASTPGTPTNAYLNGYVGLYLNPVAGSGLDGMPDGSGRFAVTNGSGLGGVSSWDGNHRALIDFTQSGHISKTLDNVADGSTYGRVILAGLTSSKLNAGGINQGATSSIATYSAYTTGSPPGLEIAQSSSATLISETFTGAYTTLIDARVNFYSGTSAMDCQANLVIDGTTVDSAYFKIYGSGSTPYNTSISLMGYISDPAEGSHTVQVIGYNNTTSGFNFWYSLPFLSILRLLN